MINQIATIEDIILLDMHGKRCIIGACCNSDEGDDEEDTNTNTSST